MNRAKLLWVLLGCLVFWAVRISSYIFASYQYEKEFTSYWSLADKASRLDQKASYIETFTNVLETSRMKGTYDALWLQTPDNSFDRNLEALQSLRSRMEEISTMDVKSFEYQQAISQITAQEQGEAKRMLEVFEGCWYLQNHFWLWGWVGAVVSILAGLVTASFGFWLVVEVAC